MSYDEAMRREAAAARAVLEAKKIDPRYLVFSPDPAPIPAKIWAPSQSQTKFQMEQALGDWAENAVRTAINAAALGLTAIAFGDNDKTLSQAVGFADRYRAGKVRELKFGKRSDLLLFGDSPSLPVDASTLDGPSAEALCRSCVAALEVRSSRTSALRYIAHRQTIKAAGARPTRMEPSITVKIEDLSKVYRWIIRNAKPLFYIQVFFDVLYALDFLHVFGFINERGDSLKLDDPARSGKKTILIPINRATKIGTVDPPSFNTVHNAHDDGRHDIYPEPYGGGATLDAAAFLHLIGRPKI